ASGPGLAHHELRLDGKLVSGKPHRLARERLGHARELEHHASRLDHRDPALRRALARSHAGLGWLRRDRLVREDVDPDLAAALDLSGHRDSSSLDLAVGDPAAIHRLQAVLAELHAGAALRHSGAAPTVLLAMLDALRG